MFDPTSRYARLSIRTLHTTDPDGQPRDVRYVERRFLPPAAVGTAIVEHKVAQNERLDNITAKYLGDPTQFWQVCDANEVADPNELIEEADRRIRIAMPGV